jgi:hypothetical protein
MLRERRYAGTTRQMTFDRLTLSSGRTTCLTQHMEKFVKGRPTSVALLSSRDYIVPNEVIALQLAMTFRGPKSFRCCVQIRVVDRKRARLAKLSAPTASGQRAPSSVATRRSPRTVRQAEYRSTLRGVRGTEGICEHLRLLRAFCYKV